MARTSWEFLTLIFKNGENNGTIPKKSWNDDSGKVKN